MLWIPGTLHHLEFLEPQEKQQENKEFLLSDIARQGLSNSFMLAGFFEGQCLVLWGIFQLNDRHIAWAIMSKYAGPKMLTITRKAKRIMDAYPVKEIQAHFEDGFDASTRWLKSLGFKATNMREDGMIVCKRKGGL